MLTFAVVTCALLGSATAALPRPNSIYEYIVVGSGPGGGPLAANLARAGHSVLLLEAGDDQGSNPNTSVLLNFNRATNDPSTCWDFFKQDGAFYVGTDPPRGAKQLGIYYPRAGTLGGCAMHNAGISAMPPDSDWNHIAEVTGDESWRADRMWEHLKHVENAIYAPNGTGHGYERYLTLTHTVPPLNLVPGSDGRNMIEVMADKLGLGNVPAEQLVKRDMNAKGEGRDQEEGIYGQLRHGDMQGRRVGAYTYINATLNDPRNFLLTVQLNSLVSKILFSPEEKRKPKAIGVEYLYGPSLYSVDPRYNPKVRGETRQVFAAREVIIAAGVFNTPQILQLSGIGPAAELRKHRIPVVVDLPGVGANMADNYEISIISLADRNLTALGVTHAVMLKSRSEKTEHDIYLFCGAFSFEGYWPGYPTNYGPEQYECALVHISSRNLGTVKLRSADPRAIPDINFNFYSAGADLDLEAMVSGINWARDAFNSAPGGVTPWKEVHPCKHPKKMLG